jgi:hypothetical protein
MTLGVYPNFPSNIHRTEVFTSTISSRQLQQNLIHLLSKVNQQEFCFEEVAIPTVPAGTIIFEFGIAEGGDFTFINKEEEKKALDAISKERFGSLDFFCSLRYYKDDGTKKTPLKFDYYMLRAIFGRDVFEVQIFHERGPRYLSPEDLTHFLFNKLNECQGKKVLKESSPPF